MASTVGTEERPWRNQKPKNRSWIHISNNTSLSLASYDTYIHEIRRKRKIIVDDVAPSLGRGVLPNTPNYPSQRAYILTQIGNIRNTFSEQKVKTKKLYIKKKKSRRSNGEEENGRMWHCGR
jgi:hypothetical protein